MTQDDHGDGHDLHMVDEDARGLRGTTISLIAKVQYGATALVFFPRVMSVRNVLYL